MRKERKERRERRRGRMKERTHMLTILLRNYSWSLQVFILSRWELINFARRSANLSAQQDLRHKAISLFARNHKAPLRDKLACVKVYVQTGEVVKGKLYIDRNLSSITRAPKLLTIPRIWECHRTYLRSQNIDQSLYKTELRSLSWSLKFLGWSHWPAASGEFLSWSHGGWKQSAWYPFWPQRVNMTHMSPVFSRLNHRLLSRVNPDPRTAVWVLCSPFPQGLLPPVVSLPVAHPLQCDSAAPSSGGGVYLPTLDSGLPVTCFGQ